MAENTTKDIWNDDDGEREEGKKRGHLLRNFLIFLLVLIAVLPWEAVLMLQSRQQMLYS